MEDLNPSSFFSRRVKKYFETLPCLSLLTQGHHTSIRIIKNRLTVSTKKTVSVSSGEREKKEIKNNPKEERNVAIHFLLMLSQPVHLNLCILLHLPRDALLFYNLTEKPSYLIKGSLWRLLEKKTRIHHPTEYMCYLISSTFLHLGENSEQLQGKTVFMDNWSFGFRYSTLT